MYISTTNIIIAALCCITIAIVKYKYHKTFFVIPTTKQTRRSKLIYRGEWIILALTILLILNIKIATSAQLQQQNNTNVQILFDVSLSMTAQDIAPSRFIAAKQATTQLIQSLSGTNISLIMFSGIPINYIPFSRNQAAMTTKLQQTTREDFPPTIDFIGTALGDAILLGVNNLHKQSNNTSRNYLIIITDGDSNKGYNPTQTIPVLQNNNIITHSIGIGNNNFLIGYDRLEQAIATDFDDSIIQEIAQQTQGRFYRIRNTQEIEQTFEDIKQQIQESTSIHIQNHTKSINSYILPRLAILVISRGMLSFYRPKKTIS